jgi:serine/threonine-protein kinase
MPDVIGQTRAQAAGALRNLGLTVTVKLTSACPVDASGTVVAENPASGTSIPAGSGTGITVCQAAPQQVVVPDVTGQTQGQATATLQGLGLSVNVADSTGCDPQLYGTVLTQQPTGGTSVPPGSTVGITVCDVVVVPDVTGQTQSDATTTLQGLGLTVSVTDSTGCDYQLYGTVLTQQPAGGTGVAAGSAVTITICSNGG